MKKVVVKKGRAHWRALTRQVECSEPRKAWDAAQELSDRNLKPTVDPLLQVMRSAKAAANREAAAYALTWMYRRELIPDFAECVADETQPETVRGQAAEALAYLGSYVRRNSRWFKLSEETLLLNLTAASPVVRFWCCFALGSVRSERAIKPLARLRRSDQSVCPGWWKVSEEAADALHHIRTGSWPERTRATTSLPQKTG